MEAKEEDSFSSEWEKSADGTEARSQEDKQETSRGDDGGGG